MSDKKTLEEGTAFTPRFDENGLIPCITTSASSGKVLMFAYMNKEALEKTISTGEAHYWSRSRNELWHKGATSGFIQKVREMRTDCDQDCIWISVDNSVGSSEDSSKSTRDASCHTGRKTCFYRSISIDSNKNDKLIFKDDEQVFDPQKVYKT